MAFKRRKNFTSAVNRKVYFIPGWNKVRHYGVIMLGNKILTNSLRSNGTWSVLFKCNKSLFTARGARVAPVFEIAIKYVTLERPGVAFLHRVMS